MNAFNFQAIKFDLLAVRIHRQKKGFKATQKQSSENSSTKIYTIDKELTIISENYLSIIKSELKIILDKILNQSVNNTGNQRPEMSKINVRKSEQAQSMVEFALTLPIILLILSGLFDLGRVYFTQVALEDSVGEAALYLSINPACRYASDGAQCADPNNAYYRAKNSAGAEVNWAKVNISFERPDVYGVGDPVRVTIRYSFDLMTPILPRSLKMNQLNLSTIATQMIVTE